MMDVPVFANHNDLTAINAKERRLNVEERNRIMSAKAVVLWSSISTDGNTQRLEDLLISKECDFEKVTRNLSQDALRLATSIYRDLCECLLNLLNF